MIHVTTGQANGQGRPLHYEHILQARETKVHLDVPMDGRVQMDVIVAVTYKCPKTAGI